MDTLTILNTIIGVSLISLGWFAKELWNAVKSLKEELGKLKEDISASYMRKDDFKDYRTESLNILQRIEYKLDNKQDK